MNGLIFSFPRLEVQRFALSRAEPRLVSWAFQVPFRDLLYHWNFTIYKKVNQQSYNMVMLANCEYTNNH